MPQSLTLYTPTQVDGPTFFYEEEQLSEGLSFSSSLSLFLLHFFFLIIHFHKLSEFVEYPSPLGIKERKSFFCHLRPLCKGKNHMLYIVESWDIAMTDEKKTHKPL